MEEQQQNDEIRLIELFAVVIRRRRWLYLGIVLGALFSLTLWLPILPAPSPFLGKLVLTANFIPVVVPDELNTLTGNSLLQQLVLSLNDSKTEEQVYRDTLSSASFLKLSPERQTRVIQEFFKKNLKVDSPDVVTNKGDSIKVVTVAVKSPPAQRSQMEAFLREFLVRSIESTKARLAPVLQQTLDAIPVKLISRPDAMTQETLPLLVRAYGITALLKNPDFPARLDPVITASSDPKSMSKGTLVILFILVGFILGLVAAFIAEGVTRMKRNPEDLALLRRAWKRQP